VIYTAVLVACLAIKPGPAGCRTHEMLISAGANPVSAYIEAQNQASQWLMKYPELTQFSLVIRAGRSA
jgi:hypothetical protein